MVLHAENGVSDPLAAIPEERADVRVDIENIRGANGHVNFVQDYQVMDRSPLPSDILHPGGTYGVKAILENPGTLGSDVTVQVVAGHTGTEERFVTDPFTFHLDGNQKKEFWTDVTIPNGTGQPFVHAYVTLPDGRGSGETDTGRVAKEKKEYSEGDIERLDRAAGKAGVAIAYALRDDGGDARIRSMFKDPASTIAAIDRTREAYATIIDVIHTVQAPIERNRLEVAVAKAVGREKPKTLVAQKEEMEEGLRVKKVGLEEGGKGIENILVDMGLEEAVLAQLEKRLMLAVSAYQVADAEGGLAGGLQSKVIAAAKSLVPKVIESARTTVNGVRYLRDRIEETATILKNVAQEMVIAAQEMGQDMFELTGESLRAYLERDKNGYFNLINALKMDAVRKAESRNGVDINDSDALSEYHNSLRYNANEQLEIFEHLKGDGKHLGKLVLVFLGNAQHLGDSQAGLYQIAKEKTKEGFETIIFRVGDWFYQEEGDIFPCRGFQLHPSVVLEHTKNIIEDRINRSGIFGGMAPVMETVSIHYSRGAGEGDRLFGTESLTKNLLGDSQLKATAYIDAVDLLGEGPVVRKPSSKNFYNVFQENDFATNFQIPDINQLPFIDSEIFRFVRGNKIDGANNPKQNFGADVNHLTIDEEAASEAWQFIIDSLNS